MATTIRPPAVAGSFYPADPAVLAAMVDELLERAPKQEKHTRAIISPHAGYVYSGPVAASAFNALDPDVKRVVVLGPTHRVGIEGMALTGADYQRTPLGDIPTDPDLTAEFEALPDVITAPIVHAQEHSMEVQLPFLQRHLKDGFTVVPVAVGHADADAVAAVIEAALAHPDTGVVISSDLSHYLPYDLARRVDANTLAQIVRRAPSLVGDQACGAYPVSGMMRYAQVHGLQAEILDARNSGDTAGGRDGVVGYAAIAWLPEEADEGDLSELSRSASGEDRDSSLPVLAYNAIAAELGRPTIPAKVTPADFREPGATFVTLNLDGQLRGCIGSLAAHRALGEDVVENARAAAFSDPRFPPLTAEELARVDLEVSELTAPVPMWEGEAPDEDVALAQLRPGIDGVVFSYGPYRATFLPQVWEQLPDRREFMEHLKQKAGLPATFWGPRVKLETYQVAEHHLPHPKGDDEK